MSIRSFFLLITFFNFYCSYSQDTIKVATYNLLRFDGDTDRNSHFQKVVKEIAADIYIAQELSNSEGVSNFLNNVLNLETDYYYQLNFLMIMILIKLYSTINLNLIYFQQPQYLEIQDQYSYIGFNI